MSVGRESVNLNTPPCYDSALAFRPRGPEDDQIHRGMCVEGPAVSFDWTGS